ncbi:hypothetical protein LINGRAHAP2_LOCUS25728, partial [Linum grandiflorum]
LPIRLLNGPSLHFPNFLESFLPFLDGLSVEFLTVQLECLLVRTLLVTYISRVHHVENGQYDVATCFLLAALHHQS